MEKLSPTPSDIEAKMYQPCALQVLDSGERCVEFGGITCQLKYYDCEQPGNPEARCNEIYEYKLPADAIERANLGFDLDERSRRTTVIYWCKGWGGSSGFGVSSS